MYNGVYFYSNFKIYFKHTNLSKIKRRLNNFEFNILHLFSNIHPISTGPNIYI